MNILVFGDSHAACLIEAWRNGGWPPNWRMQFFVRPGSGPPEHTLTGTRISAVTPSFRQVLDRLGQPAEHDLASQDALVIVGGGVSLFPVVQVLNTYDVLEWGGGQLGRDGRPALTSTVLRLAVDEALRTSSAGRLMAELRSLPGLDRRPIHLLPQPFPSERVLTDRSAPAGAGLRRMARLGLAARAAALFQAATEQLAHSFDATLHPQAAETITRDAFTTLAFTTEARRLVNLDQPQRKTDILHANQSYGRIALQGLAAALATSA